ncbi:MAG TPA: pyridoxamine 5'-phosphate oxidase family protein [Chitinophagaceae bacterium]|jgi:general stress protein 26|nr:pyridoxamine 5'-phosphate oxidase family protein [Chitinophagaceae bacterium]
MEKTLSAVAKKMKKLDICMMTTQTKSGQLASRPMSNNGDVKYNGNSYFFTYDKSKSVKDITENPEVNLSFSGPEDLYISIVGVAKLIRAKETMEEHWLKELEQWFKDGLDTKGIVMIHVKAKRIKYWQNEDEGEVKV